MLSAAVAIVSILALGPLAAAAGNVLVIKFVTLLIILIKSLFDACDTDKVNNYKIS